jgi:hypothetical protein
MSISSNLKILNLQVNKIDGNGLNMLSLIKWEQLEILNLGQN